MKVNFKNQFYGLIYQKNSSIIWRERKKKHKGKIKRKRKRKEYKIEDLSLI
jgi:hypothetical protein